MMEKVLSVAALLVAIGASVFAWMNKPAKIGYAETPELLSGFTEAIKAKRQFEEAQREWDKNLNQINDSLMAAMNRMKEGFDKASAKEREAMKENLGRWNSDLQRYSNAVKKNAEEKEKSLMEPVLNKMNSFMKQWGEQNGYDMVFGTMNGGNILQAKSSMNVTAKLLADLNAHYREVPAGEVNKSLEPPSAPKDSSKAGQGG